MPNPAYMNQEYGANASSNGISISYGMVLLGALFTLLVLGRIFGSIRVQGGGSAGGGI